ncbi:MAG: phosphohydrolase [Sphaerochaetaceae bacterium]|nr:phosphohydrolase [Sphaerochaetaceae bacterium]
MKSQKELKLEQKLYSLLDEQSVAGRLLRMLVEDEEVHLMQEYANSVSIVRLGFNDHGPVHMRQVTINAIKLFHLLRENGIIGSIEQDQVGTADDSMAAILLSSFLHDLGMAVGREDHELMSSTLAMPLINRFLATVYPDAMYKQVVVRSVAIEGIVGHMANRKIHSVESGVILLADGCDMEKGRARIPLALSHGAKVGDIHKYSSNAIEKVRIVQGKKKAVAIEVDMTSEVGYFQVEEVLIPKINMSPIKPYIELYARILGQDYKQYL